MTAQGMIRRGGHDLPCPSCNATHRIVEVLSYADRVVIAERPCCRCRVVTR